MDRAAPGRRRGGIPREGDRVPRWYGRPRALSATVPGVWISCSAYRVCRERNELLRPLSDGWQAPGRSGPLPTVTRRLATIDRRGRVMRAFPWWSVAGACVLAAI